MKAFLQRFFKKFFSFFLRGIFFIAPVFVTLYVLFWLFRWVDNTAYSVLSLMEIPRIPGLGILLTFILVALMGYLGGGILLRPILSWLDSQIVKLPLIKIIYTSIKDVMDAFVGKKKKFNQAVMVRSAQSNDFYKLGFITQSDLSFLGLPKNMIAVYLPHSYAFSGNVWLVPSENVTLLKANSADVMKFIVSGGLAHSEEKDEENTEEKV